MGGASIEATTSYQKAQEAGKSFCYYVTERHSAGYDLDIHLKLSAIYTVLWSLANDLAQGVTSDNIGNQQIQGEVPFPRPNPNNPLEHEDEYAGLLARAYTKAIIELEAALRNDNTSEVLHHSLLLGEILQLMLSYMWRPLPIVGYLWKRLPSGTIEVSLPYTKLD